jgi:hypothetical protein
MASPAADLIVLDTLGKLHAHGHGLGGIARVCRLLFRVPMPAIIAARGTDRFLVGMRPLTCVGRDARETEVRVNGAEQRRRLRPQHYLSRARIIFSNTPKRCMLLPIQGERPSHG